MVAAANRQVFKSLDSRVVRPDLLVVVVIEVFYDWVLVIGIRVTLGKVLQGLVEAVAVSVVITCSFNDTSTVAGLRRNALIRVKEINVTAFLILLEMSIHMVLLRLRILHVVGQNLMRIILILTLLYLL